MSYAFTDLWLYALGKDFQKIIVTPIAFCDSANPWRGTIIFLFSKKQ